VTSAPPAIMSSPSNVPLSLVLAQHPCPHVTASVQSGNGRSLTRMHAAGSAAAPNMCTSQGVGVVASYPHFATTEELVATGAHTGSYIANDTLIVRVTVEVVRSRTSRAVAGRGATGAERVATWGMDEPAQGPPRTRGHPRTLCNADGARPGCEGHVDDACATAAPAATLCRTATHAVWPPSNLAVATSAQLGPACAYCAAALATGMPPRRQCGLIVAPTSRPHSVPSSRARCCATSHPAACTCTCPACGQCALAIAHSPVARLVCMHACETAVGACSCASLCPAELGAVPLG
jgi:hypothetical protein